MLLFYLFSLNLSAQFTKNLEARNWWINNVNWDGKTHWSNYLTQSPAYMGPNAIPVPIISKGLIDTQTTLIASLQTHFSQGDNTQNPLLYLNYAENSQKISLFAYLYPVEHFVMSNEVRDERRLSDAYYVPKGWSSGDLYFGASVQILKNKQKLPDIAFRMATKTASGGGKGATRNTDAPAYFFDVSLGKKWYFFAESPTPNMAVFAMLGFYVWETNALSLPQNDAFLFGIGTDIDLGNWVVHSDFSGYLGYKNNGDKPIVYRFGIDKPFEKGHYLLKYQTGIHDFPYQSFEAGIALYLKGKK